MKKLAALLLGIAIAFSGCSDDNDNEVRYLTLDFESGTTGYLAGPTSFGDNLYSANSWAPYDPSKFENGADYPLYTTFHHEGTDLTFGLNTSTYTNEQDFSAGGVAISQWNDTNDVTDRNQCSVYGSGGHGGSKTFAVVYYSGFNTAPSVSFKTAATERYAESIWVTNTTYGEFVMRNGNQIANANGSLKDQNGWLLLTIEGFNAAGSSTGNVELYLADFRTDDSPGIVTQWTEVDLSPLGKVHKLTFTVSGSDNHPEYGLNTPSYFCFDDLRFKL